MSRARSPSARARSRARGRERAAAAADSEGGRGRNRRATARGFARATARGFARAAAAALVAAPSSPPGVGVRRPGGACARAPWRSHRARPATGLPDVLHARRAVVGGESYAPWSSSKMHPPRSRPRGAPLHHGDARLILELLAVIRSSRPDQRAAWNASRAGATRRGSFIGGGPRSHVSVTTSRMFDPLRDQHLFHRTHAEAFPPHGHSHGDEAQLR